jgi:aromatic ring-cleaving dioxygenase
VRWLALNLGDLGVFVQAKTNHDLRNHRDCTIEIGQSLQSIAAGDPKRCNVHQKPAGLRFAFGAIMA